MSDLSTLKGKRRSSRDAWISEGIRQLGRVDDPAIPAAVARLKIMLAQHGASFAILAEHIERTGIGNDGPEMDLDAFDYESVRRFFDLHGDDIPIAHHPWLGNLLSRLRTGGLPTNTERRDLNDLRSRVRLKGRLP